MSYVGFSISQATQISSQDARLTAVESLAATKVAQSVYDAKVALLDANDASHVARLDAVESLAATKVAQSVYDAKVALLDVKDSEQDSRLSAVEGRASVIETDISGRIQNEINEKVAQATFDALASELRNADSALTSALATKVAQTTQTAVDNAQNELIAQKATIASVNSSISSVTAELNTQVSRLDAVDASKVAVVDYEAKVQALEEFINVLLQTYTINKPDNQPYSYTGVSQNLLP